jgi:hypothetical protein
VGIAVIVQPTLDDLYSIKVCPVGRSLESLVKGSDLSPDVLEIFSKVLGD